MATEEKQKETQYNIEDFMQIAGVKENDKLFYLKNYSKEGKMTLKDWIKKTGLTF